MTKNDKMQKPNTISSLTLKSRSELLLSLRFFELILVLRRGSSSPASVEDLILLRALRQLPPAIFDSVRRFFSPFSTGTEANPATGTTMVHGNAGELSASLQDCTRLLSLDLGENGFFGTIQPIAEKLINVSHLGLRANLLTGNIPEQLCGFPILHILDLAHNNLSGRIPTCLGNLKAMKYARYYSSVLPSIEHIEFNRHADALLRLDLSSNRLSSNNLSGELYISLQNCSTSLFVDDVKDKLFVIIAIYVARFGRKVDAISLQNCSITLYGLDLEENKFVSPVPITDGLLWVVYARSKVHMRVVSAGTEAFATKSSIAVENHREELKKKAFSSLVSWNSLYFKNMA
ncbi:hypothetical protein Q3G72_008305 [Acer saccharum]|nr:hypothetical protein Q3G72_008305 [Acer saccharum]